VDRLASLQPLLYQETIINKSLQRVVVMGPFKRERDSSLVGLI
jgi:cullin-associated NEDD8-dissociated protein 1